MAVRDPHRVVRYHGRLGFTSQQRELLTLKWLLGFLVQCFAALPDHLHVQPVSYQHDVLIQRLEVEADELASFVQKKANKQWVWIAMDAKTRQIIAFHVGDRSHTSAEHLWAKIPQAYRQHATFYTDQYVVYEKVIPAAQHKAISKSTTTRRAGGLRMPP
jgi:insertion element IS1 protein InsB